MTGRVRKGLPAILAIAVVAAVMMNLVVYLVVTGLLDQRLLMPAESPPPELAPLGVVDVVLFSLVFGVGAVMVYAIVRALFTRPLRVFAVVAGAVLVASLLLPGAIPSPPVEWEAKLVLMAMHAVGYAVIVATLWAGEKQGWAGLARRGGPQSD